MHAATNTHVARFYHPPSKRKNRTVWEPNLDYFRRQFDGHPDRLKNLHFAFVVLLRAVRRAAPFLSTYEYTLGGTLASKAGGDAITAAAASAGGDAAGKLVQRLLDSSILKSCSSVFDAFDEGLLFREEQVRVIMRRAARTPRGRRVTAPSAKSHRLSPHAIPRRVCAFGRPRGGR